MKTKFTKGEWSISQVGDTAYIDSESGFVIATVNDLSPYLTDAHLIATAPEMYKLLSELREVLLDTGNGESVESKQIDDLLAKARGEQ